MNDHRNHSYLPIFLLCFLFIVRSVNSLKAATPSEHFMNWLESHQTTGGIYTLSGDVVISRNLFLGDGIDHPLITINTGNYTITVEEGRYLGFLNSNVHIHGNTTLFQVEKDASLEFSNLDEDHEYPPNQLTTKQGPAVQIHEDGMFFALTHTNITADQGIGVQGFHNGFVNLKDTVIRGDPAIKSPGDVYVSTCELYGSVHAPSIEAELTIFHDNPEINQEVYHLGYQDVTDDIYTEGYRYVNTVPDADLRAIVPQTAGIQTYTGKDHLTALWIPIHLTYDAYPSVTADDIGKTLSIQSEFKFSDFQQKLIDAGLLDVSTAKPPIIQVNVLRKDLSFSIAFSNRYILCASASFAIPPGLSGYQDVYFEISQDGNLWTEFPILSSFDLDYMDHEAYLALNNEFQDENGNPMMLEYNHTYHIRMGVKNGPMKGVSTPLVIKVTADILDQDFFNPLPGDPNDSIEHPDQTPPGNDGSIDGNRGGGGQKEGQRDKNIPSSSYRAGGMHTTTDDTLQSSVTKSPTNSDNQSKAAAASDKSAEKRKHNSSDSLSSTVIPFGITAFIIAGIVFYCGKTKKSV